MIDGAYLAKYLKEFEEPGVNLAKLAMHRHLMSYSHLEFSGFISET